MQYLLSSQITSGKKIKEIQFKISMLTEKLHTKLESLNTFCWGGVSCVTPDDSETPRLSGICNPRPSEPVRDGDSALRDCISLKKCGVSESPGRVFQVTLCGR